MVPQMRRYRPGRERIGSITAGRSPLSAHPTGPLFCLLSRLFAVFFVVFFIAARGDRSVRACNVIYHALTSRATMEKPWLNFSTRLATTLAPVQPRSDGLRAAVGRVGATGCLPTSVWVSWLAALSVSARSLSSSRESSAPHSTELAAAGQRRAMEQAPTADAQPTPNKPAPGLVDFFIAERVGAPMLTGRFVVCRKR